MQSAAMSSTQPAPALEALRAMAEVLDDQAAGLCLFDGEDRTLLWNRSFMQLFPEHDGLMHAGEPYADNLRRFYAARLGESDPAAIEKCVAEGLARHRAQHQPFSFEHGGRWLRVASLPIPGIGRVRVWTVLPAPPSDGDDAVPLLLEAGTGDGWAVTEPDGRIARGNAGLARLFALPHASAVQGMTLEALLRHAWRGGAPEALERVLLTADEGGRFIGIPFELELPGGRWLRVLQQRRADGGTVSSFADITAPKALQAELLAAREAAEAASRGKDALLATVRHELRTPLHALIGLLDYLGEDGLAAEARRRLALAQEAAAGMLSLVEDILRFSALQAGGEAPRPEPTDIRAMVEGVRGLLAGRAAAQGLALSAEVAPTVPQAVHTDGPRLRQVLLNLVGNALKFTPAGSIAITARREEDGLVIEVADTGTGIPAEAQARIFEPFMTAGEADGRRHGGSGLGLAISRSLVRAMGGEITLDSTPGAGSRFRIHLPQASAADATTEVGPPVLRLAGLRVLVVDDQALNREVARLHLTALGAEVGLAADGPAAIAAAPGFDVVLMDLDMPGMDGFTAAQAIRAADARACILALTAHAGEAYRQRAAEAGLAGVVTKPVTAAQLGAAIAGALVDAEVTAPLREALGAKGWDELLDSFEGPAREALAAAGGPGRGAALHALKGMAWNDGARRAGDAAAALERLPAEAAAPALPALRRLLEASLSALRAG